MNAQNRHVDADNRLAHEGRKNRGIVTNVDFTLGGGLASHDCDDTLQYVIFATADFS